jgi:excinuclease ABC subunit A
VYGLSPVISIEQKTMVANPRSTVGTMTDIASYLNLLYATIGDPHCPRTGEAVPSRSAVQIVEAILGLPEGTEIELRAPVFMQYGEELDYVLTEVRKKGCRTMVIDGRRVDISEETELDETQIRDMDAVVDRFVVGRRHEKAIKAGVAAALVVGDGLLSVEILRGVKKGEAESFYAGLLSKKHRLVYGEIQPEYFMFNNPESACRTCGGLGVHKVTHPDLLVPDTRRSIRGGCLCGRRSSTTPIRGTGW